MAPLILRARPAALARAALGIGVLTLAAMASAATADPALAGSVAPVVSPDAGDGVQFGLVMLVGLLIGASGLILGRRPSREP